MTQTSTINGGTGEMRVTVELAPCLGLCEHAPAVLVQEKPAGRTQVQSWKDLVRGSIPHQRSIVGGDIRLLTRNCGKNRTTSLEEYEDSGGYAGLRKALSLSPAEVIAEVKASGLVGRGGAAFPTGVKWEATASAPGDRTMWSATPMKPSWAPSDRDDGRRSPPRAGGTDHRRVRCGRPQGTSTSAASTSRPTTRWRRPRKKQAAGYLGENILGTDYSFEIEIAAAPLISAGGDRPVRVHRRQTRVPAGQAALPHHPRAVRPAHRHQQRRDAGQRCPDYDHRRRGLPPDGHEKSPGPKLFCLSGDVVRPGLYEVPFGVTFRHLLFDLAGGLRPGREFRGALFGGAAGAFATPDHLDVVLSFEDLRAAGLPLGSGVITVFDDTRDLYDILLRLSRFFAEESCGKCYPCQIGTQRQHEILVRMAGGDIRPEDYQR